MEQDGTYPGEHVFLSSSDQEKLHECFEFTSKRKLCGNLRCKK